MSEASLHFLSPPLNFCHSEDSLSQMGGLPGEQQGVGITAVRDHRHNSARKCETILGGNGVTVERTTLRPGWCSKLTYRIGQEFRRPWGRKAGARSLQIASN
jgi:hypothetical protein